MLALTLVFITGCGKAKTEEFTDTESVSEEVYQSGSITLTSRKPDTFNPLATNYESCRELFYLFYDGLFTLNEDFSLSSNLAEDIIMSDDNLTGILTIKSGIRFADGSYLTAHDVLYSVEFIRNNGGSFLGCVKNIKEIEVADNKCVVIRLNTPEANFASMLVFPIIKDGTPYFIDCPNGTGQFVCEKENCGQTSMMCEKNPEYHLGVPKIDTVNVVYTNTDIKAETGFLTGNTDVIIDPGFDSEKAGENVNVYEMNSNRFEFIGFNSGRGIFSDDSARKAIFAVCDREEPAKTVDEINTSALLPVNPLAYFCPERIAETDFGKTHEILERNGWTMGGNGVYVKGENEFSFSILVNSDNAERVGIANYLSHTLLAYGISADVEVLSYEEYKDRLTKGEYDAFMGGCTIGNPANPGFLLKTGGSANVFGYSDEATDAKIRDMAVATGEKLKEKTLDFVNAVSEKAPLAGIYFKTIKVFAKKHIVIPEMSPTGVYTKAYTWFLA